MHSSGIQSLIVLTDPSSVFALDLVHEGVTSSGEIAERVSARLGTTVDQARSVLDGLVGLGWVGRAGPHEIESLGLLDFGERVDEGMAHLTWLRSVGEETHVDDIVGAITAAWNTRSRDPRRQREGARFAASAAGRRHAARRRARTVGIAFSDAYSDDEAG